MGLFGSSRERLAAKQEEHGSRDERLKEELSELMGSGKESRELNKALNKAEEDVVKAKSADAYGIKLIEHGRCPECHGRVENLLYTSVCPSCGWFQRMVPDSGRCVVHLDTGGKVQCDRVYHVNGNKILCMTEGVVRDEVMNSAVRRIEYVWEPSELEEAKLRLRRERTGVCSWCDRALGESPDGHVYETYAAIGAWQERYAFCCPECYKSFTKQYPSRVHRNCYETDCNDCEKCIKRYDTHGFKKEIVV